MRDIHVKIRNLKCPWPNCGSAFSQKSHLESHFTCHVRTNPLECEICTKQFALKKSYNIHVATHRNDKPKTKKRYAAKRKRSPSIDPPSTQRAPLTKRAKGHSTKRAPSTKRAVVEAKIAVGEAKLADGGSKIADGGAKSAAKLAPLTKRVPPLRKQSSRRMRRTSQDMALDAEARQVVSEVMAKKIDRQQRQKQLKQQQMLQQQTITAPTTKQIRSS